MKQTNIAGLAFLAVAVLIQPARAGSSGPVYHENFQEATVGAVPDEIFVLDGGFAVRQSGTNQYLELPGAPLESFGVLFGPTETEGLAVSARIYGTNKGRRMPTFAVGLNGGSGYKLQVSPAKKLVELYQLNDVKASVPYDWKPGGWTCLELQVIKDGPVWRVHGKAWPEDQPAPAEPLIRYETAEKPPPGRASVWGSPFSGTPIQFDDLTVNQLGPE